MTDYSELKRLAEAAAPGPWRGYKNSGYVYGPESVVARCGDFKDKEVARFSKEQWGNDATYIAAASPSVVLAILAELDALRASLAEAAREINAAGPVAQRIRLLKQTHAEELDEMRRRRDEPSLGELMGLEKRHDT